MMTEKSNSASGSSLEEESIKQGWELGEGVGGGGVVYIITKDIFENNSYTVGQTLCSVLN